MAVTQYFRDYEIINNLANIAYWFIKCTNVKMSNLDKKFALACISNL